MTAATWQWYKIMGEVVESNHTITPMALGSPSTPGEVVFTVPSEEGAAASNASTLVFLQDYKPVLLPMAVQDFKDPTGGFVLKCMWFVLFLSSFVKNVFSSL